MSATTDDHGYDLARMVRAVEGQGSETVLTLSGTMTFRDILSAVNSACKDTSDRESSTQSKPARKRVSRSIRSRGAIPVIA